MPRLQFGEPPDETPPEPVASQTTTSQQDASQATTSQPDTSQADSSGLAGGLYQVTPFQSTDFGWNTWGGYGGINFPIKLQWGFLGKDSANMFFEISPAVYVKRETSTAREYHIADSSSGNLICTSGDENDNYIANSNRSRMDKSSRWTFEKTGQRAWYIQSVARPGMYLTIEDESVARGTSVYLQPKSDKPAWKWKFYTTTTSDEADEAAEDPMIAAAAAAAARIAELEKALTAAEAKSAEAQQATKAAEERAAAAETKLLAVPSKCSKCGTTIGGTTADSGALADSNATEPTPEVSAEPSALGSSAPESVPSAPEPTSTAPSDSKGPEPAPSVPSELTASKPVGNAPETAPSAPAAPNVPVVPNAPSIPSIPVVAAGSTAPVAPGKPTMPSAPATSTSGARVPTAPTAQPVQVPQVGSGRVDPGLHGGITHGGIGGFEIGKGGFTGGGHRDPSPPRGVRRDPSPPHGSRREPSPPHGGRRNPSPPRGDPGRSGRGGFTGGSQGRR